MVEISRTSRMKYIYDKVEELCSSTLHQIWVQTFRRCYFDTNVDQYAKFQAFVEFIMERQVGTLIPGTAQSYEVRVCISETVTFKENCIENRSGELIMGLVFFYVSANNAEMQGLCIVYRDRYTCIVHTRQSTHENLWRSLLCFQHTLYDGVSHPMYDCNDQTFNAIRRRSELTYQSYG